jgi:hypothetical protein
LFCFVLFYFILFYFILFHDTDVLGVSTGNVGTNIVGVSTGNFGIDVVGVSTGNFGIDVVGVGDFSTGTASGIYELGIFNIIYIILLVYFNIIKR